MPHILISRKIADSGIELLRSTKGFTVEVIDGPDRVDFRSKLKSADGVILFFQPLKAEDIAAAEHLQVVSRHGVGYDSVDVAALNARRIPLTITPGANAVAVAEHALSLLLAVARRACAFDKDVRAGQWAMHANVPMFELVGKKALVVGLGRIGKAVAERLLAFGVQVQVYDPFLVNPIASIEGLQRMESLPEALAQADIVSLHLPLTPQTTHLLNPMDMKRGAILVNTSRGGVVDEVSLVHALHSEHLYGAGLDVFETEPLIAQHPLCSLPNVVLSPHVSSLTDGGLQRMSLEAAQNVIDYFSGSLRAESVVTDGEWS